MSTNETMLTNVAANTELVLQFIDAFWNRHDRTAVDRLIANDYVDHAYQPPNHEGLAAMLVQLSTPFPDHQHLIESHVAQDDLVVLRMRFRATHLGDFRGTPPTNSAVDVPVYRMYRVAAGQIVEHWALLDTASLLRQIGATAG